MTHKKRKGFTIIELIVVIAIIGILVLLASMMFKGHVEKARIARISNDIKATETVMSSKLIDDKNFIDDWENISDTELQKFAEQGGLYDKEGNLKEGEIVKPVIPGNYKKIEKEEIKDQLKSGLPGDFYINEKGGEVYYYDENVKGTPTPDETVEVDPPLTEAEITDLVENHDFIPVANADELNQIRPANLDTHKTGDPLTYDELTWGAGTQWEDKYTGTMDSNYVQVAHIDLKDYGKNYDTGEGWKPIGYARDSENMWDSSLRFAGKYNGANYHISNLFINRPEDYQGLFGSATGATLSNIVLQDIDVTSAKYTGGLVGRAEETSKITNSYATGEVSGADFTGGLAGYTGSSSEVTNSYTTGSVSSTGRYTGGLVGRAHSSVKITDSYATGSVSGTSYIGGLVGDAYKTSVTDSYARGSVSGTGSYTGGLVGRAYNSVKITDSHATGSVSGGKYTGGLVGHADKSTIMDSYATSEITSTGEYTGGLVGRAYTSTVITNSYATGSVTGESKGTGGLVGYANKSTVITNSYATGEITGTGEYTGGLVGSAENSTEITNSHATGEITGTGEYTGGLVGYANLSTVITNSYATGSVSGTDRVGGLAGYASVEITNSYATGSVSGRKFTGGLVGQTYFSTITNSHATGSVSGEVGVGGLVGQTRSSTVITNSYATGSVSGEVGVGGLVGHASSSTITNSYYDEETTLQTNSAGGTGLTTAQMKEETNFKDWDFTSIWAIDEGSYPYLISNPQSPAPGM